MKNNRLDERSFCIRMTLSLLSILACVGVMASSAYALFNKQISAQTSTLVGAYYDIEVSSAEGNLFRAPLAYDDKYTFEIKAAGTASIGYCKIQIGENVYFTDMISQDDSIILTVQAARDSIITFTPQWGAPPVSFFSLNLADGDTLYDSVTPHAVYTVEPTAKLSSIAAHYGVSEEEIIIYNNLIATASLLDEEPSVSLEVGAELRIPGEVAVEKDKEAPYAVPYAEYVMEPTAKLDEIARYYDVPKDDILAFNAPENLEIGAVLKIPYAAERSEPYAVPFATYTVEPTANIGNVALYYDVPLEDIMAFNEPQNLITGGLLKIPYAAERLVPYAVPFTTYHVEPTARLEAISDYYGVSVADILAYNGLTVNDYIIANTDLKIPSPREVDKPYRVPYTVYVVEPTANIDRIADHYGVTPSMIKRFNGIEAIEVGQELKIPYPVKYDAYSVPYTEYVVQPVARLMAISLHYGVSVADILAYNKIELIYAGLKLKIPSPREDATAYSVPYTVYKMEPTAVLAKIANHYGVSVIEITKFNGKEQFAIGNLVKIPYPTTSVAYAISYANYIVPEGATLDDIAKYYGVLPTDITAFNPNVEIKVGASIKIPGVASDTAPYVPVVKTETTTAPEQTTTPAETTGTPEQTTPPAETTGAPEQTTVPSVS